MNLAHLLINCFFLRLEGTFRPLQRSHHLSAGTAWDSRGSLRTAPGISVALSTTEAMAIMNNNVEGILGLFYASGQK